MRNVEKVTELFKKELVDGWERGSRVRACV